MLHSLVDADAGWGGKLLASDEILAICSRIPYLNARLITFGGKPLILIIYIILDKTCAALRPYELHGRSFRAAKDHVQPLAALDSLLPEGKKILI